MQVGFRLSNGMFLLPLPIPACIDKTNGRADFFLSVTALGKLRELYAASAKEKAESFTLSAWCTIRGSNPGHPD